MISETPSIQEVKKQHQAQWLAHPNVVSVGLGLNEAGEKCIVIGVSEVKPEIQSAFPEKVAGHLVEVKLIGKPDANFAKTGTVEEGVEPSAQGYEPSAQGFEPSAQGPESSVEDAKPSAQRSEPSAPETEPSFSSEPKKD